MEERTNTEFPSTGLGNLETTERSDVGVGTSGTVGGYGADTGFAAAGSSAGPSGISGEQGVGEKARRIAGEQAERAKRMGSFARDRMMKNADQRKGRIAAELDSFAGTLDDLSRTLQDRGNAPQQKLVEQGSKVVRSASKMLREKSSEELLDRAQSELRQRPGAALAGAFALGFLGIRLLRS